MNSAVKGGFSLMYSVVLSQVYEVIMDNCNASAGRLKDLLRAASLQCNWSKAERETDHAIAASLMPGLGQSGQVFAITQV